ncbi:hypothetical protein NKS28_28650 [Bacillus sp. 1663tsa1]|uniref:hypothetical protein n=1 Tax=Bacillus TaxID=1386 RepID=UPI00209DE506|nr:hypothetical protein [Bacillus sp. 1663tsa1]MCP1181386.1 hypothetical protein [Bacillus sp. 1663tsa1]
MFSGIYGIIYWVFVIVVGVFVWIATGKYLDSFETPKEKELINGSGRNTSGKKNFVKKSIGVKKFTKSKF